MFFFCIGLPSRFGEWCQAVTVRLVERTLGPAQEIRADDLEQFLAPAIAAQSPFAVVGSHCISGRLWTALAEADRRFVLALDNPHHAVENLVARHGTDFLEATRGVAKSCVSALSCASLPAALVLHAERDADDPAATATAIARHFGLPADPAEIAEILESLAEFALRPEREAYHTWWERLDESQRAVIAGALDPFAASFAGGELGTIVWERDLFFISEEPPRAPDPPPASRPVDITGRPRHLLYGPYMTLPPGSWSATIALGFSPEAAELSYVVEIGSGTQGVLCAQTVQPGEQRLVELGLSFTLAEPDFVEIRIGNERAAFDGRLALGYVVLTPVVAIRAQARSYLESALGG